MRVSAADKENFADDARMELCPKYKPIISEIIGRFVQGRGLLLVAEEDEAYRRAIVPAGRRRAPRATAWPRMKSLRHRRRAEKATAEDRALDAGNHQPHRQGEGLRGSASPMGCWTHFRVAWQLASLAKDFETSIASAEAWSSSPIFA